ncbi:Arf-GAP domain and FG repeat-containing protein 1 [Dissostichus eleginoides]|uniref:Arf-GAP domain and FG repeat-containing protein 1 n=1 Tax=Dissostichus eleginoides TaxID=100907 RepID=A0AAD9BAN7_DISEL|nr:Arf-GAP domain and FG repeat-containing protein 1 [Dissostichus eleginoides]
MATSAKRKQEETHLKMLREMTSLPANRKCFDCDQRGPTYVNMTVGSFVCTTCSGIFVRQGTDRTPQSVMGLSRSATDLAAECEGEFCNLSPDQARAVASVQASVSGSSASSTGSTPEVQHLKTLQLNKTPLRQSPGRGRSQVLIAAQEKKFDLLADLGGDIFAAPPTQTSSSTNFANFAHFPSHSGGGVPIPSMSSAVPIQIGSSREDRYAALAELDNELSSSVNSGSSVPGNLFGPVLGSSPAQNPPVLPSMHPGFGSGVPSTNPFVAAAVGPEMATNPFQANGRAPAAASFGTGSMSMPAGFGNASSYCLPTSFSGNFQQQFPGQAPIPYSQPGAYHPQSNGPAFPVYGQNKPSMPHFGQPMAGPGMSYNPFMAGAPAGAFPSGGSTNPFL